MSGTIASLSRWVSGSRFRFVSGGCGQSKDNSSGEGREDLGNIISVRMASITSSSLFCSSSLARCSHDQQGKVENSSDHWPAPAQTSRCFESEPFCTELDSFLTSSDTFSPPCLGL